MKAYVRKQPWFLNVTASDAIRHALASFMQYGTFDKFPKLKLAILEVGAGWVQYWLDRMDAVYDSVMGRGVPLKEKPSFYFRRNVWVSADPDEKSLPAMVNLCGSDRFFWATDFPHPDHTGNYIEELEEFDRCSTVSRASGTRAGSTTSCWRKMRFSASSRARLVNRDRVASNSWVRNATIGRFTTIRPAARHPG